VSDVSVDNYAKGSISDWNLRDELLALHVDNAQLVIEIHCHVQLRAVF
jgi:hypothetical protein